MAKKVAKLIKDNLVAAILILFYLTLTNYFFGYVCPSMILIGLPCPGCGLTRAAFSLASLDFSAAYRFNPMIFAAAPLVLLYFSLWLKGVNTRILFYPATAVILLSIIIFFLRLESNFGEEPFVINHGALLFRLLR